MSAANYNRQEIYVPLERTRFIRRRNKYDILAEILAACKKQPRTQSWLLTHLRLSTSSAKEYVGFLLASRLLDANETEQHKTTIYTKPRTAKKP
jgi:predicted transcriptional regulator